MLSLGFAHHLDDLGERRIARSPGHFHFERARSVDRPCKDAIVIRKIVRIGARRSDIRNRALVDRHAFTGHRSLIDGTDAVQDETIGRKAFIRTHYDHVANRKLLDRNLNDVSSALYSCRFRRELGERLDRPLGAAHRVVFERVAETEQEQQKRAFGPFPKKGGARSSDKHEAVDFEPAEAQIVPRLSDGKESAKEIRCEIAREWQPSGMPRP